MLIDGIQQLPDIVHPVCIVGSGPAGLACATALTRAGIPVLVLESGGKRPDRKIQELAAGELVRPELHDDLMTATARRLGGASNLWGGRSVPYDPIDFAPRDWVDARWPISHEEVMRWIPGAAVASASGAAHYRCETPLTGGAAQDFDPDAMERWVNIQAAQHIHADAIANDTLLQIRLHATCTGLEFHDDGRIRAITVADPRSGERARIRARHFVIAAGGLETTRLLLSAQCEAASRFGGPDGPLGRHYMGHVIGEIADIVLARDDLVDSFRFEVDSFGSYVRRRIALTEAAQREHKLLNTVFWPVVPPIADARHQNAILSSVYLALAFKPLGRLLTAEAIRTRHVPTSGVPIAPHLRNILTGVPSAIGFIADFLRRRYTTAERMPGFFVRNKERRFGLSYHAEHAPHADSRVTLRGSVDRLGLPQLRIDLRFTDQDFDSILRSHALLEGWLARHGIGHVEYRAPQGGRLDLLKAITAHGTHQIGLARMGDNRREAVVDGNLATFDAPNLHLATSAVLPTSSQANPTLTTIALALRLADRLSSLLARCNDDEGMA
ncbi:FAD-dependent oxidoreductase [Novosphingobium sp. AAP93]|uniref:FAD-dependent oxidoreductase n=1 Tax=Novosphingobium sp. AAP93 TaxID=1523427 RepID=UPI0006B8F818|nr:FAD-dependent oxidoreductase [Novosphingobium sp. AAP93]KPF89724.1 hypothetical protein IP83_01550 [Novosphingobium sp. AAP93]